MTDAEPEAKIKELEEKLVRGLRPQFRSHIVGAGFTCF